MKTILLALAIILTAAHANGLKCYLCPYSSSDEEFGQEEDCGPLMNACETLAIDDAASSLKYNRRCSRNSEEGCQEVNIQTPDGVFPGRICFCQGDLCNTIV